MSSGEAFYGSVKKQYFVLVDSSGAVVNSHTFVSGDAYLIDTGQTGGDVAIHADIAFVSKGVYSWTPSAAAQMQVETAVVRITDSTAAGLFIDQTLIIQTGGHGSAYFDAGT